MAEPTAPSGAAAGAERSVEMLLRAIAHHRRDNLTPSIGFNYIHALTGGIQHSAQHAGDCWPTAGQLVTVAATPCHAKRDTITQLESTFRRRNESCAIAR